VECWVSCWQCGLLVVLVLSALCVVHGGGVDECEGDCKGGEGSYVFPDGSVYKGWWEKSRFHGKGEMQVAYL